MVDDIKEHAKRASQDIAKHFLHLHALLQLAEKEALVEVKSRTSWAINQSVVVLPLLREFIVKLNEKQFLVKVFQTDIPKHIHLESFIQKQHSTLQSISQTLAGHDFTQLFKIQFENSIQSSLKFVADRKPNKQFNVGAVAAFALADANAKRSTISMDNTVESGNCLKLNKPSSTLNESRLRSRTLNVSTLSDTLSPPDQLVSVSHINSPHLFYVQSMDFVRSLPEFQKDLFTESISAPRAASIKMGTVYIVVQNMVCYRVITLKDVGINHYKVQLIDFGLIEIIEGSRFQLASERTRAQPHGASVCTLHSINSVRTKWTAQAKQLMIEIIGNGRMTMFVLATLPTGVRVVELISTNRKYSTSVREALIGLNHGQAHPSKDEELLRQIWRVDAIKRNWAHKERKQFERNIYKEGDMLYVRLISIVSPLEFYLMQEVQMYALHQLHERLQALFAEKSSTNEPIYAPKPQMICAAFSRNAWHRARICSAATAESTDSSISWNVWLIDSGTMSRVQWQHIRELDDSFLTQPEAVTYCGLAYVETTNGAGGKVAANWSTETIDVFRRATQHMRIHAHFGALTNGCHSVTLLTMPMSGVADPVNINAMLVDRGLAAGEGERHSPSAIFDDNHNTTSYCRLARDIDPINKCGSDRMIKSVWHKDDGRTRVKLLRVEHPGEFYVMQEKFKSGVAKMHQLIQEYMHNWDDGCEGPDRWRCGDLCLVLATTNNSTNSSALRQWHRGRIVGAAHQLSVFLRDRGEVMVVDDLRSIVAMPEKFKNVSDGATRCHMACVRPTGNLDKYASACIDELRIVDTHCEALAISAQGERKVDSISVVLWGLLSECDDPLMPVKKQWMNINRMLCGSGLAQLTGAFRPLKSSQHKGKIEIDEAAADQFDDWLQQFLITDCQKSEINVVDEVYTLMADINVTDNQHASDTWLEARPIEKSVFVGVVTYVDQMGVLYLHEFNEQSVLDHIRKTVNAWCAHVPNTNSPKNWISNQSCLAKFDLDGKYYRAVVLDIDEDIASIQFVDYGNVETCPLVELRSSGCPILASIGIMARKYCLADVRPILTETGAWPQSTIDFLHQHVVEKQCNISTKTNHLDDTQDVAEIIPCRIVADGVNLHDLLLNQKFIYSNTDRVVGKCGAMPPSALSARKAVRAIKRCANSDRPNDEATAVVAKPQREPAPQTYEEYEQYFNCRSDTMSELEYVCVPDIDTEDQDAEQEFYRRRLRMQQASTVPSSCSYSSTNHSDTDPSDQYVGCCPNSDTDSSFFEPYESSTQISQPAKLPHWSRQPPFIHLRTVPLSPDQTIYGKVVLLVDGRTIWMQPELARFADQWRRLQRDLNRPTNVRTPIAATDIRLGVVCLSIYKEDMCVYRAMVQHYDSLLDEVTIVFVDYMNIDTVHTRDIFACPAEYLPHAVPLRSVLMRFRDVRVNPRLRESDVKQRLAKQLHDVRVRARVVRVSGKMAKVTLYAADEKKQQGGADELLYQDMIDDRFYVVEKEVNCSGVCARRDRR